MPSPSPCAPPVTMMRFPSNPFMAFHAPYVIG
jgi:hypothetical protein